MYDQGQAHFSHASTRLSSAVHDRLREIIAAPAAGVDTLATLAEAGLVTLHHGLELRDVSGEATPEIARNAAPSDALLPVAGAIGRVDPRQPRVTLADGQILGMYVQDCTISTDAEPPYLRLPSLAGHTPYHIVYLLHFGANETHTVVLTLQVFSVGGTVRITGTGNATALVLGQSSVPISLPMTLTTTDTGFASILIQRVGQTGFDWFATDVL